jgi:3-hydroxyisobutyrate dehydrogenase
LFDGTVHAVTSICFLGLGRMGTPMARRLLAANPDLVVWNRSGDRTRPLTEAGAAAAPTPAQAVAGRDLVISMLSDPDAVEQVFFGPEGAAPALAPGSVVIEMSTIGPPAVRQLRDRLPAEVRLVDAPVVGSVPQATAGELRILAGGADDDVERCRETLSTMGTVQHIGPLGQGAAMKLVVNTTTVSLFVMVAEALALADRLGLDPAQTVGALGGTGIAPFLARIGDRIDDLAVPTYFAVNLAKKDLALARAAAGSADRLMKAGFDHLAAAVEAGLGDRDISTVIHFLRGLTPAEK